MTPPAENDEAVASVHITDQNELTVPGWFTRVASIFGGLATLWATWVTMTLHEVTIKLDMSSTADKKIELLVTELHDHVADPHLHISGISNVAIQLKSMEARVTKLEARIDSLSDWKGGGNE